MALKDGWQELAIQRATGGMKQLVDAVTEEAPILAMLPMSPTSDGMSDIYEVLVSTDFVPESELNAPLTEVNSVTRIEQTNLRNWACKMLVGVDQLKVLKKSAEQYFADKSLPVLRETGAKLSRTIYDSLLNYAVANYAADNSRAINCSGNNNTNFTITAVKWVKGETTGLYSQEMWGNGGKVVEINQLSGGNSYEDPTTKIEVFGRTMRLNSGLKLANARNVASIVNIDKGANLTTISLLDKIDEIILQTRGADALYMSPFLKSKIGQVFKYEKIELRNQDNSINRIIDAINNVPIITDFNLPAGTGANITL